MVFIVFKFFFFVYSCTIYAGTYRVTGWTVLNSGCVDFSKLWALILANNRCLDNFVVIPEEFLMAGEIAFSVFRIPVTKPPMTTISKCSHIFYRNVDTMESNLAMTYLGAMCDKCRNFHRDHLCRVTRQNLIFLVQVLSTKMHALKIYKLPMIFVLLSSISNGEVHKVLNVITIQKQQIQSQV
jgi:hypothetical protein